MVSIDRTAEFCSAVQDALKTLPDNKRRHPKPRTKRSQDGHRQSDEQYAEAYLKEAYAILEHINNLNQTLSSIRHAYLNVDFSSFASGSGFSKRGSSSLSAGEGVGKEGWEGVKRLTEQDRDAIDLQAKVILRRCLERVKQLEALEEKRTSTAPNKSALLRLLPSRLIATTSTSDSELLAAHFAGITWYLNRKLAESSNAQREMQEERVRRQLERAKSLGGTVAASVVGPGLEGAGQMGGEQGVKRFDPSVAAATIGVKSPPPPASYLAAIGEDEDAPLSEEQMQLFEQENASILRSAEHVLAQVQRAESSLHEIGQLQSELVHHLTLQTEMTDRLYEEAVSTQAEVERGNAQLRRAKERGGDARRWLLVFLVGASLALLFLHYYS